MGTGGPRDPRGPAEKTVGELVFEVTERTSNLIRDEIELAKAEVTEKITKLLRGSVAGIVAGVLAFLALILLMFAFALGINDLFFDGHPWAGFLIEAALFLIAAAAGGFFAYRSFEAGAPPVPDQAIEEAKLTRNMLEKGDESP